MDRHYIFCHMPTSVDGGVLPDPTVENLFEGCRLAKEGNLIFS